MNEIRKTKTKTGERTGVTTERRVLLRVCACHVVAHKLFAPLQNTKQSVRAALPNSHDYWRKTWRKGHAPGAAVLGRRVHQPQQVISRVIIKGVRCIRQQCA